jgi:hypothetical protein
VNGKAVARAREEIYAITDRLGLKGIDELTSFERWDEEFDLPEEHRETITPWFEAREGIEWVGAIRREIESIPSLVREPQRVLSDLGEYDRVLRAAGEVGARWHFEMDL